MREIATTREAAAFLRLSPRTLERWRYLGCGPPYLKLGGRCVYCEITDPVGHPVMMTEDNRGDLGDRREKRN